MSSHDFNLNIDDAASEEHLHLLLASLVQEQELANSAKPWNEECIVDCGSIAGVDSSCCFWKCLYFWTIYLKPEYFAEAPFSVFKRTFYPSDNQCPFEKSALPQDIKAACNHLKIKVKVQEVDGFHTYSPENTEPKDQVNLVLFDGHYRLLLDTPEEATKYKEFIKKTYWQDLINS